MNLKTIIKKILLGDKVDGATYLNSLRKQGIEIGEGTVLFSGPMHCVIDTQNPHLLTIGKNVQITHGVILLTHDYSWSVIKGKFGEVLGGQAPLTIGNNVFIGMNAILLAGTNVGDNVVIGAGAVVKGNIPSNVVVAGNPARIICTIEEYREKRKKKQLSEAVEVFCRYVERCGEKPSQTLFREYFWLFCGKDDSLPKEFAEVNLYVDHALTSEVFSKHSPIFSNYSAFEQYCLDVLEKKSNSKGMESFEN